MQSNALNQASKPTIITISDRAASQIQYLLKQREQVSLGIKIEIKPGGCTGFSYHIKYVDTRDKFDELVSDKGVNVFIDPKAVMYLLGTEMDYIEDKFESGFKFINPNEKAKCGCGKSVRF